MTFSKLGDEELADNMPVIKAGIPADRLVVEVCSYMHLRVAC